MRVAEPQQKKSPQHVELHVPLNVTLNVGEVLTPSGPSRGTMAHEAYHTNVYISMRCAASLALLAMSSSTHLVAQWTDRQPGVVRPTPFGKGSAVYIEDLII